MAPHRPSHSDVWPDFEQIEILSSFFPIFLSLYVFMWHHHLWEFKSGLGCLFIINIQMDANLQTVPLATAVATNPDNVTFRGIPSEKLKQKVIM